MKLVSEKNMWLAPLVLGIIGGIYAYWKLRDKDKTRARKLLVFGIIVDVLRVLVRTSTTYY